MKRILPFLSAICLGSILLAGCTQTNQTEKPPEVIEQKDQSKDQTKDQKDPVKKDISTLEKEITVKYPLEGMEETKKASLYISTNQPFYTYVVEGYEATPAEPGLDQIFYKQSSENNMNVEVYEEETTLVTIESNVIETLKTIGEPEKMDPKEALGEMIPGAEAYWHVSSKDYSVTVVIVKIDGVYAKFTIHTVKEWESIMPFLVMIETTKLS